MGLRFYFVLFIISILSLTASAQKIKSTPSTTKLLDAFSTASKTYNVPEVLFKSVAYTQTRFTNMIASNEEKVSKNAPPVYGIMGLRNDNWFGHSLLEGAKLIGANPDDVAVNESLNIRAAAALLSSIADSLQIDRSNINNWRPVIEKFSGIPQAYVQPFYSYEVFMALSKGVVSSGIRITQNNEVSISQFPDYVKPNGKITKISASQSADYPPAEWLGSPNYTPDDIQQLFLVVHVTQETFAGTISLFEDPSYQASAHYLVRSSDGKIVQFVREHDKAWHVRCWNSYMIGVEHEGWVSQPQWFTEAMYESSAALFRHLVTTYNIPVDSNRIIGHYQWSKSWWVNWVDKVWDPAHPNASFDPTCNNHTDPGPYWDWHHFFNLIEQGGAKAKVVSFSPSTPDSAWSNSPISITFDEPMADESTQSAFNISPSVTGNFEWSEDGKTMTLIPSTLLTPATKYTVTIDTSALSILNTSLDSTIKFSFYTRPAVPISIIKTYPENNSKDISTSVKLVVEFNTPMIDSSLDGNILFQDSAGNSINIENSLYYESNNKGYLSFSASDLLDYNSIYKVIIKSKVQSANTSTLGNNYIFNFRTISNSYTKGTVVESFNSTKTWQQPALNSSSTGIDSNSTKFFTFFGSSPQGSYLGRLVYVFNGDSGGICILQNLNSPSLGSTNRDNFGVWVDGDLSYNSVGAMFTINGNENKKLSLDTLNWTGWKFIKIPFSDITSNGEILFNGLYIKQNVEGSDSNQVSFAGVQYNDPDVESVKNNNNNSVPLTFKLAQNYPNPFNPSTTLRYTIPKQSLVTLKIYDALGRLVATLVNEVEPAGNHSVVFNADKFKITSGIYFYTLKAGEFTQTKKLVLMK